MLGALSEASLLWAVLLERVVSARLRVDFGRDGTIGFEREEREEPERGDDEPEGGWGS